LSLTIAIFIKEAKGFLELGNLLFGQLISHGEILIWLLRLVLVMVNRRMM
jgi:hypothetical protein